MRHLGNLYENGCSMMRFDGSINVEKDFKTAFRYWKILGEKNISLGSHKCGQYFQYGYGCDISIPSAIRYYTKSTTLNNSGSGIANSSYLNLVTCLENQNDSVKVFKVMNEAYQNGYFDVSYKLGEYYRDGKVTQQDLSKAYELFSICIERGSYEFVKSVAKYYVAMLKQEGMGCEKDIQGAMKLLEETNSNDFPQASYKLAQLYYEDSEYDKAYTLFLKIINDKYLPDVVRGDIYRKLSACYRFGRGVNTDLSKADELINIAASFGNPDGKAIEEWLNSVY